MNSTVFTDKKAGEYFNSNFVNAKFDAEKGEGADIAKKYEVKAYPSMFILNSKGEVLGSIVGRKEANELIEAVKEIISAKKRL